MDSDQTLVRRAVAGDASAFEALVQRYRAQVLRVASRIVGPSDAEDVTQDVFVRAFHRLDQFRGESPFRSWLLRIAHNVALNTLAQRRPHEPEDAIVEQDQANRARTPAEELEVDERRQRLALKVRQVQPQHRAVLVLRDVEGLSYDEISRITDQPLGSVKGRLFRARRELIEILRRNTYDWELPR
jgi:RNA polymerase sigma-70 factor, ECF subfamily